MRKNDVQGVVARASLATRMPLLIILAVLGVVSTGCALPGYESDAMDGEPWYSFGNGNNARYEDEVNDQIEIRYEPRVVKITPGLIHQQRRQRVQQRLDAAEERISVRSKTAAYKLGPGDVLQVIVYGHPELTNPTQTTSNSSDIQGQLINANGTVYFPYVGDIQAAGLTISELRQRIAKSISDYIRDPQIDVRVMKYRSQQVYISGDISKPCAVPITDVTLTLLQALDQCPSLANSSPTTGSDNNGTSVGVQNVVLVRDGRSMRLDLNRIYSAGRSVPLQAGDHLLVDDSANRVFMVGEFDQQLALPYSTGGMSLDDAIADAGGVSLGTADTSAIYVIRGMDDDSSVDPSGMPTVLRPKVFKLDASSPVGLLLANQFQLEPRDIVFAAPASLVNFNRAFAQITPALNTIFQTFLIYDRSRDNN